MRSRCCRLDPFGKPVADLPVGVTDYATAVRVHGDQVIPERQPGPALDGRSVAELLAAAADSAAAQGVTAERSGAVDRAMGHPRRTDRQSPGGARRGRFAGAGGESGSVRTWTVADRRRRSPGASTEPADRSRFRRTSRSLQQTRGIERRQVPRFSDARQTTVHAADGGRGGRGGLLIANHCTAGGATRRRPDVRARRGRRRPRRREAAHLGVQRPGPRQRDPHRQGRNAARRGVEQAAHRHQHSLARAGDRQRHGRRSAVDPVADPGGRELHLRVHGPRRRNLLVSLACRRTVGPRPVRPVDHRGPRRDRGLRRRTGAGARRLDRRHGNQPGPGAGEPSQEGDEADGARWARA